VLYAITLLIAIIANIYVVVYPYTRFHWENEKSEIKELLINAE